MCCSSGDERLIRTDREIRASGRRTFLNLVLGELEFVSNLGISSLGFIQCRNTFRHQTLKKGATKKAAPCLQTRKHLLINLDKGPHQRFAFCCL